MDSKWKWRDEEIQLAQFNKLTSIAKQQHIKFLLSLPKEQLGTNDEYILRFYGPTQETKTNKFLNLNDE